MTDPTYDVFLSYSRADAQAAANLRLQLAKCGLSVFKDDETVRAGELWLQRLQEAIETSGSFAVLVGRDGVSRWIAAETQSALSRHFAPHDDAHRLPIFPILLEGIPPESLPAFLRLFELTLWNGTDSLPKKLLEDIRARAVVSERVDFEGCPFVGLSSYRPDQAQLFFGRQKETLDALVCFDARAGHPAVRWLEISGDSGSGKSSLMNAGLLPLVEQGWLWPRTGYPSWHRIGPMMPGEHPLETLAEHLGRGFDAKMGDVYTELCTGDAALRYWLRDHKQDGLAFLVAIDQFEELFTFAEVRERRRFDRLLTDALDDPECPLFLLTTVRADFLDRFAGDLPLLAGVHNRVGKSWRLAPISADGLREVIAGPARLAGLDVSEVQAAMVAEARDEPGALPLTQNALYWLWQNRIDNRLSGQLLTDNGGLAGILSSTADGVLAGLDQWQRGQALELLFRMVHVDPEGRRHTRRRISFAEAVRVAGGGESGRALVDRLAGQRQRRTAETPPRVIIISEDTSRDKPSPGSGRWVDLIHDTLIRSKGLDAAGNPEPYWPTLWHYVDRHKERAARRERLQLRAQSWSRRKGLARLRGLAGWSALFEFRGLAAPGSFEQHYLRWSTGRAVVEFIALASLLGAIGESLHWVTVRGLPFPVLAERWAYMTGMMNLPLPSLVPVPAGTITMGSDLDDNTKPRHRVTVAQPLRFGSTEVTFRQWDACVADSGCNGYRPADQGWGRDERPVINVSWDDAQAYVKWLSTRMRAACRLPSEAEWEYAARAGTITEYALPAPDGSDDIAWQGLANCVDCGGASLPQTLPVSSFQANAWGLHDMHGNVWEWIEDCTHTNYQGAPEDGTAWLDSNHGDCGVHVLRGGSWSFSAVFARSTDRSDIIGTTKSSNNIRRNNIGFRVLCESLELQY